ncbi:hypothetical protein NUSPORA_01141 [Nucleospora cyclopteri]
MKIFNREFAYKENLVFVLCDYYEERSIPSTMFDITSNLCLFPIDNTPLIDYILQNLLEQNRKNIVLVGDSIEKVIKYVMRTKYDLVMNISYFSNDDVLLVKNKFRYFLSNIGQFFRSLRDFNIRHDFLVIQGNHFTTLNFKLLQNFHKINKNHVTFFIYKRETNDPRFYKYDFSQTGRVFGLWQNRKKVSDESDKFSSPNIFYSSPEVCSLFNEFVEANDFCQLVEELKSVFAFGKFKFFVFTEKLLRSMNISEMVGEVARKKMKATERDRKDVLTLLNTPDKIEDAELSSILEYEKSLKIFDNVAEKAHYYSKEITTVLDYIEMNKSFREKADDILSNIRIEKHTNKFKEDVKIEKLSSSLKSLQVDHWNVVQNTKSNNYVIDLGNGEYVDANELDPDIIYQEDDEEGKKGESFFDEAINYLKRLSKSTNFEELDLDLISKNITLFKIYWNTTSEEVVEVYAAFFIEVVADEVPENFEDNLAFIENNSNFIEDIICRAATFFSLLQEEFFQGEELETHFMETFVDYTHEFLDEKIKYKVFYAYCYLLRSCKTIKKQIIKKYIKEMEKAELDSLNDSF